MYAEKARTVFFNRTGRNPATLPECYGAVKISDTPCNWLAATVYELARVIGIDVKGITKLIGHYERRQLGYDDDAHWRCCKRELLEAAEQRLVQRRFAAGDRDLCVWWQGDYMEDCLASQTVTGAALRSVPATRFAPGGTRFDAMVAVPGREEFAVKLSTLRQAG